MLTNYQPILGKKEIVRGLGTQDLAEALVLQKEVIAEILSSMSEGKTAPTVRATNKNRSAREGTTISETAHRWLAESDGVKNATKARYRQHLEALEANTGNVEVTQIIRT
nr:hypothetical protein [Ruegeria sp. ANG-R]